MTERIYYHSDALEMESQVISCTPQEDGRFHVILSATLFHPQGGGQPSDQGTIGGVNMIQAIQQGDSVIHITDAAVEEGTVHISVDANLRLIHTRYHSAGHLIGVAGEKYGWQGNKGNHRPGEGRVVFDAIGLTTPVTAENFAEAAAEMVARDLALILKDEDGKRMVTWGDLTPYACGGTHVKKTSEIGEIRIIKVKEKKGQLSVQYELGN
ncbi:alanyl-tRNA editing protein [Candidatus Pantoea multigeneris]|uniref:Alanyl-tRNA editing protein n=1 Tax=Candidatus Pantoea multigeneris TaxID=2608357 RepID=A0ABX0R9M9_9GAMM|nr:alanyl-tRNA editing protein [Pantoea multigeneris]NIF22066.1 alanyl-tRNA editing protein [Pantoea multigeneris]